jgi:SAM-dependent methyltransferase
VDATGTLVFVDDAGGSGGFEPEYFDELAQFEASHFWFRSRNRLISWALRRFFPEATSFFEAGCGNGIVLQSLQASGAVSSLAGAELFGEGLAVARGRLPGVPLYRADICRLPFEDEFDVVGAFDVLEHVPDDALALSELARVVVSGGGLLITVPQHPWLWSAADEYARHERRYDRRTLCERIDRAGFEIVHASSFVVLLLPALIASRVRRRRTAEDIDPLAELRVSPAVNATLEHVLDMELALTRRGVRWPAGGSLLVVARSRRR